MKTVLRLLFRKPAKVKKPKKQKKSLLPLLMDRLMGIPVSALERRLNDDMWKPDF